MNSDEPNGLGLFHHFLLIAPGGSFCVSESRSKCSALPPNCHLGSDYWKPKVMVTSYPPLPMCSLVGRFRRRRRTTTQIQNMQKLPEWCTNGGLRGTQGLLPLRNRVMLLGWKPAPLINHCARNCCWLFLYCFLLRARWLSDRFLPRHGGKCVGDRQQMPFGSKPELRRSPLSLF